MARCRPEGGKEVPLSVQWEMPSLGITSLKGKCGHWEAGPCRQGEGPPFMKRSGDCDGGKGCGFILPLESRHHCLVITSHPSCKGECGRMCSFSPLLQGIELEGMHNSKIDPRKAHSFHVIKGSEQRKSEISMNQRPVALRPFQRGSSVQLSTL